LTCQTNEINMKASDRIAMKVESLKSDMVHAIREELVDKETNDEGFVELGEDSFEDDAHNRIMGLDDELVYFTDRMVSLESYPLHQLSFDDGVSLLHILENK
jgi:hypothetical protein